MILYHGSCEIVKEPEIRISETFLDFGSGFYTTTFYPQAERWARIKMRRNNTENCYVSVYEFDEERAEKEFNIKRFNGADKEWLDFVVKNRRGDSLNDGADMYIGPVADDNVYKTIRLFETGAYDSEYTVKRLKTEILHDQWSLHTKEILECLTFVKAETIK